MKRKELIERIAARLYAYNRVLSTRYSLKHHFEALSQNRRDKFIRMATEALEVIETTQERMNDE